MEYSDFLAQKGAKCKNIGFEPVFLPEIMFDFQKEIASWAVRKGKSAIWAGCGLGKTIMQLVWAHNVVTQTGGNVIILAPLGVTAQTKREAKKHLNLEINVLRNNPVIKQGINIINYESLHKINPEEFDGVVLDESGILKNFSGKIKTQIIESFYDTKYKLCCSATPSPNDYTEIGNHAEFLNICSRTEMLATYFIHDSGSTQKWRLKGHAQKDFFGWISDWAIMIEKPSDLGFDDEKMQLPPLNLFEHRVQSKPDQGELFIVEANTLNERRIARRKSIVERCKMAAEINNASKEMFLNWCDLNDESALLTKLIDEAVEIKGSDKNEKKEKDMLNFATGKIKKLITKPKIAQFGMNLQKCHNMCFVGLSDSFEAFYQAVRRCYRFGQVEPVNVHIIISDREGSVLSNIKRKEANAKIMLEKMVKSVSLNTKKEIKTNKNQDFIKPSFMGGS